MNDDPQYKHRDLASGMRHITDEMIVNAGGQKLIDDLELANIAAQKRMFNGSTRGAMDLFCRVHPVSMTNPPRNTHGRDMQWQKFCRRHERMKARKRRLYWRRAGDIIYAALLAIAAYIALVIVTALDG